MRAALSFLTPFGRAATPGPRALDWFPIVGAAIGLAVGGVWWGAGREWSPAVAAGLAVAADVVLTGALHLDGLADSADALVAPMTRARRLEVLRDPAVGAFGAVALIVVLFLRGASFATTPAVPLTIGGLWCVMRLAMAGSAQVLPYARPDGGLVSAFLDTSSGSTRRTPRLVASAVVGLAVAVTLVLAGSGARGLAALGGAALGFAVVVWFGCRRLGGFTGDLLGAAGVIGETVGLVVLASR